MPTCLSLLPLVLCTATVLAQAPPAEWRIRVGDEGLTERELEVYKIHGAREIGTSPAALTPAQHKTIEQQAIDEEILFQAAIARGLLKDQHIQRNILDLYHSSQTTAKISPSTFPEAEIEAYFRAHPAEFMTPVECNLVGLQIGAGSGIEPKEVDAAIAKARRVPDKQKDWRSIGWVKEGDTMSTPLNEKQVASIYRLTKGQVSQPLKDSFGTVYLFWCKDSKPSKAMQLADCRAKVVHKMIVSKQAALSGELDARLAKDGAGKTAEERKLAAAMAARQHRDWSVRKQVINLFVANSKMPREALVESLRSKYRVAAPPK